MELVLVGRSNVGKSSVIRQLTGKRVRIGKRPGVTRSPLRYRCGELDVVDMPGFGYLAGVSKAKREAIKTQIIRYLEKNKEKILVVLQVLDVRSFGEIVERWRERGQIPVDLEMFQFLRELRLKPIVVANKIDLIYPDERDWLLDELCEKLDLSPPWRQWPGVVVPISARTCEGVQALRKLVKQRMRELGRPKLARYLK